MAGGGVAGMQTCQPVQKKVAFMHFQKFYAKIYGHYEHIQSPPTPSRKILFDPPKNTPKWGEKPGKILLAKI
jgi:hypothetical protein